VSALSKKPFSNASSPILACNAVKSTLSPFVSLLSAPKTPGGGLEKLVFPLRDLVRVNVELLRPLGQSLIALHGCQGHFCLEARRVVATGSFRHLRS
jgi:hypothetical protein